jgi:hypothetical protein
MICCCAAASVCLQHARGLEAFSKLIPLAPELLVPLLVTSFECMAGVPLEQSGQLPPPAKVTLQWKEDAMARLAMAKVGAVCSKTMLLLAGKWQELGRSELPSVVGHALLQ